MSYWSFEHKVSEDDIVHYGRKGMKWYQNIFTSDSAKARANKKMRKLDANVKKTEKKMMGATSKAIDKDLKAQASNRFNRKIRYRSALKAERKAAGSVSSVRSKTLKAKKFAEKMQKRWSKIGVDAFDKDTAEIGQKYINTTLESISQMNLTANAYLSTGREYRRDWKNWK